MNSVKIAVNIVTHKQVLHGCTEIPYGRRLLDYLNNQSAKLTKHGDRFLQLSDVTIFYENGTKEQLPTFFINKSAILFVTTPDRNSARGVGANVGAKGYPFTPKSPLQVKLLLPNYTLLGHMYCSDVQTPHHILEGKSMFLPLTDIKARASEDNIWSKAPFAAVNRDQIFSVN